MKFRQQNPFGARCFPPSPVPCDAVPGLTAANTTASVSRSVILTGDAEQSASGLEADLGLATGVRAELLFGAPDENDVMRAQLFIAHFEILADGNRAFEPLEENALQLLGRIAVGSRVGPGAVHKNRGAQAIANIGSLVHRAARVGWHSEANAAASRNNCAATGWVL